MRSLSRKACGFTLIELLVVVLIVGILVSLGLTQYAKTVEIAKSEEAFSIVQTIGNQNRTFNLDKSVYLNGELSACDPTGTCNVASTPTGCDLMYCGYLARQDLRNKPYQYYALNGSIVGECANVAGSNATPGVTCGAPTGTNFVACAKRRANGTLAAQPRFQPWGYAMTREGVVTAFCSDQPMR